MPLGHHAGEIVVDSPGQDGAEGDPQEDHKPPQGVLERAEDRTEPCDVEQLDQKQLPLGHDDIINAVVDADGGSFAVVRTEGVVDDLAVSKVTDHQDRQTNQKRNHDTSSPKNIEHGGYGSLVMLTRSLLQPLTRKKQVFLYCL